MAEQPTTERVGHAGDTEMAGPDAHGQAALLLVESLIHGLIGRSIISVRAAVEVVDVAIDVKQEVATAWGDSPTTLKKSLNLLNAIRSSLSRDLPEE